MTIVADDALKLQYESEKRLFDQYQEEKAAFEAHQKEIQQGGALRRTPYKSTGIGAIVGAIGATAAAPALAPVSTMAGAAVGELAEQGYHIITAPTDKLSAVSPKESLTGLMEAGRDTALGEVGGLAWRTARPPRYLSPRELTPEQVALKSTLDKNHIPYLPHEITGSGLHKFMADIADNGIFNKGTIQRFNEDINVARKEAITSIADTITTSASPHEVSKEVVSFIRGERDRIMKTVVDPMYNDLRQTLKFEVVPVEKETGRMIPNPQGIRGPNGQVLMQPEKEIVKETKGGLLVDNEATNNLFQKQKERMEFTAEHEKVPDLLKTPWYQTVSKYSARPDSSQWVTSLEVLQEVRREIRAVQHAKAIGQDTQLMADMTALKSIESAVEKDLQRALETSPVPEHKNALLTWQSAQAMVRDTSTRMRNDVVEGFISKMEAHGGEPAMKQLVMSGSAEDLVVMKEALKGRPDLQNKLSRAFVQDALDYAGAGRDTDAVFNPKKFSDRIFGKDQYTARKADVLLDTTTQAKIKEFVHAAEVQMAASEGGKTGSVFVAMKQSGALMTIPQKVMATAAGVAGSAGLYHAGKGDTGTAALEGAGAVSILLAPNVLAKLLTNRQATEYLIQGMRYSLTNESSILRVTRELMRLDEGFARVVQGASHAVFGAFEPPPRTAETVEKAPVIPSLGAFQPQR